MPGRHFRAGKTLLVASTGGHLDELRRLSGTFSPALEGVEWVTFDTPQSRELLAGQTVHFVPFVAPKDLTGTRRAAAAALRLLSGRRYVRVVSGGAAVAVPFLTLAQMLGMGAHYIESAARSRGPSMTGAMLARVPGVRLYAQYPSWAAGRWQYRGTIFDGYTPGPARRDPDTPLERVVVTFGTQRGFGFRRAVERLADVLPPVLAPDAEVLWQTGATDTTGLGIRSHVSVPLADMRAAVAQADLVISHAGIGSSLITLDSGRCPLLLPRRHVHGEHTDDHQRLIAEELAGLGLAANHDASLVTKEDLMSTASMSAARLTQPPPFLLQPD